MVIFHGYVSLPGGNVFFLFFGFQRGWHHPWTSHRQVRKEVEEMTRLGYHGKMLMAMFQNRIDATWFTMIQDPYFFYKIHIVLQEASRCFSNGSFWSSDLHSWNTSILELFPNVHSRMAYSQIHTRISTWKRWWTLCNKARLKELKEMSQSWHGNLGSWQGRGCFPLVGGGR